MNARARYRLLPWLLVVIGSVACCTRLEKGSDVFEDGVAGSASGSGAGVGASGGGAVGSQPNETGGQAGTPALGAPGAGAPTAMLAEGGGAGAGAVETLGGAGGAETDCLDPQGFDGRGCYSCEPTDVETLENACSDATCVWFDNARRVPAVVDGELPELPALAAVGGSGGSGGSAGSGGGGAGSGGSGGFACDSLATSGTVVYVTGSSAAKPFLQQIAQQLALQQVYLIYTGVGSCTGVDAIVNGTLMRTGAAPLPTSATYWDSSSSTGKACVLPAAGVAADLGISDVFAPSCPGFEFANLETQRIRDAHGPIQTMTFAVAINSKYREISQQAAYMLFGFGKDGGVLDEEGKHAIWNDENGILQRGPSSGTQAMLAAAIGVPSERWKGKLFKSSDDIAAALQAASATQAEADATIGIIGADYIDSRNLRAQIRVLAYQDSSQACAVSPDSTDTAKDKRNVRDGHYPIWGPLHLLYKVNGQGEPANAGIRDTLLNIVGYLSGSKALPNGVSLIDVYAQSGLVPECAMRVARVADGGAIVPTSPAAPCSCLFEKKATGSTACRSCKVLGDCSAGQTCSRGYCEQP
ncbi:MAG TPA: hypothetical protein VEQ58_08455 [Polyangiaceae bacterium]|nr:hypothetical protein [Polyangiaceae bacterium]